MRKSISVRYTTAALTATLLVPILFGIAGCDTFSLLDQFDRTNGLRLVLQKSSILQGETIELYPSGGTPPYSFGESQEDIFYHGTPVTPDPFENQTYTAGTSIGRVRIILTDAAGDSVDVTLTVLPPTPKDFLVDTAIDDDDNAIYMEWSYGNTDMISGFRIEYSIEGGTFMTAASPGSTATNYTHTSLNKNKLYKYRMYAVAGEYLSLPTAVLSDDPDGTP